MTEPIRVGTRRSRLARAQTDWVIARLARDPGKRRFVPTPTDTSGDRDRSIGSSPDFTDAIDRALLRGEVDLAVHSAKDLPVTLDRRFELLACPRRADARDCLVLAPRIDPRNLPRGARIGSSSLRRRAQLLRWRSDLRVKEIRGNVDTRIDVAHSGKVDAVVLAVAGVSRLGRTGEIGRILPSSTFLPAPAQGALAVVARAGDSALASIVRRIDHPPTHACVTAERAFAAALGSDCRLPLGALATYRERGVTLTAEVLAPDGRRTLRSRRSGRAPDAARVGSELGREMLDRGALDLLAPSRR